MKYKKLKKLFRKAVKERRKSGSNYTPFLCVINDELYVLTVDEFAHNVSTMSSIDKKSIFHAIVDNPLFVASDDTVLVYNCWITQGALCSNIGISTIRNICKVVKRDS